MEILLLGGIYYPGLLLALAGSKKENGRFAEGVFKFVLTPLLIAAFVIVYLYIIKIIVTLTLPSNEVFGILTALFAFGLPIWTLTMSLKPHVMSRISSKLPLCFIPFIILQCICVFLRIKDYGFTFSRYMGITLIVFEIGYLCLYFIKNAKYVSFTLYYALILMFIVLLAPGINAFAAVTNSHKNILKDLPPKSEIMQMKAGHIAELAEAYRIILREGSIEGRLFLDKNVPKDTGEYLDRYYYDKDDNKGTTEVDYYVYLIEDFDEVDIRGYKTLDFVHADYHEPDISKVSLCYGYNLYRTEKEPLIEADLSKLLTDIADKKTAGEEPSISEPVETASGLLYLNRLDVDFTEDVDGNYKFDNLTIQGFLIQK